MVRILTKLGRLKLYNTMANTIMYLHPETWRSQGSILLQDNNNNNNNSSSSSSSNNNDNKNNNIIPFQVSGVKNRLQIPGIRTKHGNFITHLSTRNCSAKLNRYKHKNGNPFVAGSN
jgi:hypothetical protein